MSRSILAILLAAALCAPALCDKPHATETKPQYERLLKGDDAKMAAALDMQVKASEQAEKYDDAIQRSEKLLALRKELQGAKHWETLNQEWDVKSLRALAALTREERAEWRMVLDGDSAAQALEARGQHALALPLREEMRRLCEDVFGKKHPAIAVVYENLGGNLNAQGRYAQANTLLQTALDLRGELLGEKHPDTIGSYQALAKNLSSQGRYSDAQLLYQRAVFLARDVLGPKHVDTASSYYDFAENLNLQGKLAEAQPLYQKALDLNRELLGERHLGACPEFCGSRLLVV